MPNRVMIKGAGDLASGVAHRLHRSGFNIAMLELPRPLVVRTTVAFASSVYQGEMEVEGVRARLAPRTDEPDLYWKEGVIPVYVDPQGELISRLCPHVLIDATMAKRNVTGTRLDDAPIVIGLGPGFTAPRDVHAVVETKRGHDLGRVIFEGTAAPNTGVPGEVAGYAAERLLRAPAAGIFRPQRAIGELVQAGETVAFVNGNAVVAAIDGMVRGMLFPGLTVEKGMKVGDIDPRGREVDCYTISDKARAVAGGVLEAILYLWFKGGSSRRRPLD